PDLWYIVPGLERAATHSLLGFFAFCLPAALLAYGAYHLLFKRPLIELLPRGVGSRFVRFASQGLPRTSWLAVIVTLALGVATHLLRDAATHAFEYGGVRVAQHASTALGTAVLLGWSARWLQRAPRAPLPWRDPNVERGAPPSSPRSWSGSSAVPSSAR